ncbi:ABC transporter permease [Sulfurovum sp.]|uniref:ABC transporter permease n=1 Tax=Sulfurovum sp. TaxID=1969726 RepID=UPI0025FFD3A9|nr:ABC transporter permease [Sulfurovum sp.]
MKLGVIKAYMFKELTELLRTRLIVMVYLMPSMVLMLFGYGIRMDVSHARTLIIDNDQSKYSRVLTSKFEHSRYFDATVAQMSEKEALHRIKQAKTDIIVIIPSSFEKRLLHGQKSEIGVFVDAAFPTRATTMENYVQGVILNTAQEASQNLGMPKGMITLNNRNLFNQAMRDEDAIVPGLIGLVLLVAPAILAALLIVKEKENGTIFNFYASALSKREFLAAKLIPVLLLHSVNIFILFLVATKLFDVPFRGSFTLYWLTSELYILISLSIGMLISVVTKRQIVAVVLTVIITIIPGFLYSGILMPISSMVGESYIEAHMFPVMYYTHILYDTFLIGEGLASAKTQLYLVILVFYALVMLSLGTLFLKKELK